MRETWTESLDWEDPLEKGKAIHSSMLSRKFHRLHSLWDHKESDTTEWISLHFTKVCIVNLILILWNVVVISESWTSLIIYCSAMNCLFQAVLFLVFFWVVFFLLLWLYLLWMSMFLHLANTSFNLSLVSTLHYSRNSCMFWSCQTAEMKLFSPIFVSN